MLVQNQTHRLQTAISASGNTAFTPVMRPVVQQLHPDTAALPTHRHHRALDAAISAVNDRRALLGRTAKPVLKTPSATCARPANSPPPVARHRWTRTSPQKPPT